MVRLDVLVVLGSGRKNSDTQKALATSLANINYELLDLLDLIIYPYNYDGYYPKDDDFNNAILKMVDHDKIIFATPVYWYAMSGVMKNFFDRLTDIVTIRKELGRQMKGKKVYVIAVGAEDELPEGFEVPFKRTADYLDMEYVSIQYIKRDDLDSASRLFSS